MKFLLLVFMALLIGCSQKAVTPDDASSLSNSKGVQDLSFLKTCSQIRIQTENLWLLTCQRPPHAERTEIYEWNQDTQKLKRLTYQDGQIWDIAPLNPTQFFYSSSYDEFKEQFVSVLSGAKPGSDIYLKSSIKTDFQRMTSLKGLEYSFFWSASQNLLYFVHENEKQSRIMTLNPKNQVQLVYSPRAAESKNQVRNPIMLDRSQTLYWIEYDTAGKTTVLKSQNKLKKTSLLYSSDSKIFQLSIAANPEELLVGFATGVGVELWNLNTISRCWNLAYRIDEPVSEFYVMNEKSLFLTIRNGLKQDSFLPPAEVCHPSPPGLGVTDNLATQKNKKSEPKAEPEATP